MCQITLSGDTSWNMCQSTTLTLSFFNPSQYVSMRLMEGLLSMLIPANSITHSKMDKLATDTPDALDVFYIKQIWHCLYKGQYKWLTFSVSINLISEPLCFLAKQSGGGGVGVGQFWRQYEVKATSRMRWYIWNIKLPTLATKT